MCRSRSCQSFARESLSGLANATYFVPLLVTTAADPVDTLNDISIVNAKWTIEDLAPLGTMQHMNSNEMTFRPFTAV